MTNEVANAVDAPPVVLKRLVLLAARVMGPGPLRLKMVKLAHDLTIAPPNPRGVLGTPVEVGVSTTDERF